MFNQLFYGLVLHNDINTMSSGHPWIGNPLRMGISIGIELDGEFSTTMIARGYINIIIKKSSTVETIQKRREYLKKIANIMCLKGQTNMMCMLIVDPTVDIYSLIPLCLPRF